MGREGAGVAKHTVEWLGEPLGAALGDPDGAFVGTADVGNCVGSVVGRRVLHSTAGLNPGASAPSCTCLKIGYANAM